MATYPQVIEVPLGGRVLLEGEDTTGGVHWRQGPDSGRGKPVWSTVDNAAYAAKQVIAAGGSHERAKQVFAAVIDAKCADEPPSCLLKDAPHEDEIA